MNGKILKKKGEDAISITPASILQHLNEGQVIPAHPLALTRERKLDENISGR